MEERSTVEIPDGNWLAGVGREHSKYAQIPDFCIFNPYNNRN